MDKTFFGIRRHEKSADLKAPFNILVNQLGYLPRLKKRAVITEPCDSFCVKDNSGRVVFEGVPTHFGFDKSSGDDVYIADFSPLCADGEYRVYANGKSSPAFNISACVYKNALDDTLKALYFLRCGCELDKKHAGEYTHPACHLSKAVVWSEKDGKNAKQYDVSGGWHDAGDYGRYVTAAACTVAHLLYAYIMFPDVYKAQNINIPESGSGMPDILCECRYELLWLLKMQREDGGVWHKVTTAKHAAFVMPQEDLGQLYLFDVSSSATADFAAVCALAARVYSSDKDFSERLTAAALKADKWLRENPDFIGFKNPEGCNTGSYGEHNDTDNRFWANAELYALTGDESYHNALKITADSVPLAELGYACVSGLGTLAYLLCCQNTDSALSDKMKNAFYENALSYKQTSDSCGYFVALEEYQYCWGCNMNVGKSAMTFIISDYLSGKGEYGDYAAAQLDYLLGVNATGYSYITGCGEHSANYPHLRPAHADKIEKCMPGFVVGGANPHPCEPEARTRLPKGTPPMKCYIDEMPFYSLNEVAIYWNSPVIFVLGYLNGIADKGESREK